MERTRRIAGFQSGNISGILFMNASFALFSDLDGTLCFTAHLCCFEERARLERGTVLVYDPHSLKEYEAFDVSGSLYRTFLHVRTRELLESLRTDCLLYMVTGARPSSIRRHQDIYSIFDGFILESGGVILDRQFEEDQDWKGLLEPQRLSLPEEASRLQSAGLTLDIEGRSSALRIRHVDNPHLSKDQFSQLHESLDLPANLRKTRNMGHIDIILKSAGKENAVQYILQRLRIPKERSFGVGDDVNDMEFLEAVGRSFALGSGHRELLANANRRGMYVSRGWHFEGIDEILSVISAQLKNPVDVE